MTTLAAAFAAANRQEHQLAGLLSDLKNGTLAPMDDSKRVVSEALNHLNRSISDLGLLVQKEPGPRRSHWKAKVEALQARANLHRSEFVRLISHHHEASIREQLFSRPENRLLNRAGAGMEHQFMEERNVLQRADEQIEIAIGQASQSLREMRRQRDTIKGARTVVLSVLGQLGLSNTVLRLIQRRHTEDRLIVYGGMVLTTFIIGFLIYYFRWR